MTILSSVADVGVFTPELARCLSLVPGVESILGYTMAVGILLLLDSDGNYRMRRFLQRHLLWKRKTAWDTDRRNDALRRTCEYACLHERFDMAPRLASLMVNANEIFNPLAGRAQRGLSGEWYPRSWGL